MYSKQTAIVKASAESQAFEIQRGVKQGDPTSSFLFITVMEVVFRTLKRRWSSLDDRRVGDFYGMVIDDPLDPLTNLRFADDVLLVASSTGDVRKMIYDHRVNTKSHLYQTWLQYSKKQMQTDSKQYVGIWSNSIYIIVLL